MQTRAQGGYVDPREKKAIRKKGSQNMKMTKAYMIQMQGKKKKPSEFTRTHITGMEIPGLIIGASLSSVSFLRPSGQISLVKGRPRTSEDQEFTIIHPAHPQIVEIGLFKLFFSDEDIGF